VRLVLDSLEDRCCPSGGCLLVGSIDNNTVLRYNEGTGAFVDQFDPHNLANLKNPTAGVFGPDGNLYVSSGIFQRNNHEVLQFNGTTGAFQSVFASQNVTGPRGVLFGPDGNLYVADASETSSGALATVLRFDGKTGAFLNYFVSPSSNGGLENLGYMVFGPDGRKDGKLDLYVAAVEQNAIYRYDGTTGAFRGVFVTAASNGLVAPAGIVFGPDGNLYVASGNTFSSSAGAVLRFDGPSGKNPGAPDPAPGQTGAIFVPGGSGGSGNNGGLANPSGILFGPNGDLFVASSVEAATGGVFIAEPGTSQVLRFNGTTGAFIGNFVTPDSGGLKNAWFLTFTETDPTTLKYNGATTAGASTLLAQPASSTSLALVLASPPSEGIGGGGRSGLCEPRRRAVAGSVR
jgi:sugar lactone lactonase YvrE